jgi:hypothetical protein
MFDPSPERPDDTLIEMVRFPTLMREALANAGLKTIGDIRETLAGRSQDHFGYWRELPLSA